MQRNVATSGRHFVIVAVEAKFGKTSTTVIAKINARHVTQSHGHQKLEAETTASLNYMYQ